MRAFLSVLRTVLQKTHDTAQGTHICTRDRQSPYPDGFALSTRTPALKDMARK
jgi:hypothetical protein